MDDKSLNRPRYQFGQQKAIPRQAMHFEAPDIQIGDNGPDAKTAPVKMVARSGKPVEHWYWGNVVHDLAGMQLSKPKIPIDYCHDCDEVIGYANKFDTSTGDLIISGALVPFTPDADDKASEVLYKAKEGVPYEASINFGGDGIVIEEVAPGFSTPVNGYQFQGPGIVIRKWPLRGVAICPYGADMNTSAEFADQSGPINVTILKKEATEMSQPTTPTEAATPEPAVEVAPVAPAAATPVIPTEATALAQNPAEAAPQPPVAPAVEAKPGTEFVTAFGDVGARWFLEGKQFSACAAEFISNERTKHQTEVTELKASHESAIAGLNTQIEELKTKLAAVPRGNEPASFSADGKGGPDADKAKKLSQNLGTNTAKFAAGIKFAEQVVTPVPVK